MHIRISSDSSSARSTIVKKIKRFIIWHYKWSRVTFTELLSAVVKVPWRYHHFPWLSMTFAIFHDFPGLENGLPEFHDFPWPGGTLDNGGRRRLPLEGSNKEATSSDRDSCLDVHQQAHLTFAQLCDGRQLVFVGRYQHVPNSTHRHPQPVLQLPQTGTVNVISLVTCYHHLCSGYNYDSVYWLLFFITPNGSIYTRTIQ